MGQGRKKLFTTFTTFFFENNYKPVFRLLSADGGCTDCVGVVQGYTHR